MNCLQSALRTILARAALVLGFALVFSAPSFAEPTDNNTFGCARHCPVGFRNVFSPIKTLASALLGDVSENRGVAVDVATPEATAGAGSTVTPANEELPEIVVIDPLEERSTVWLDEDSKVCLNYDQGGLMVMLKSRF